MNIKRQAKIVGNYAEILLTKGKTVLIDIEDIEKVCQWNWSTQVHKAKNKENFYARRNDKGKHIMLHRFLMNAPEGLEVDHKNGNGLDNRKSNLRLATKAQNNTNISRLKNNKFRGVYSTKKGYRVQICHQRKPIHLGYFNSEKEAATVYNNKAIELFGEFAVLNFIKKEE